MKDESIYDGGKDSNGLDEKYHVNLLAEGIIDGYITTDNPSDSNGLNTIQQYLWFRLGNLNNCEYERIVEKINDSVEEKAYYASGLTENTVDQTSVRRFSTELRILDSKLKEDFAKSLLRGQITEDNPSPTNNLNSLEQIIYLEYNCKTKDEMEMVKKEILGIVYSLRGGCSLPCFNPINH